MLCMVCVFDEMLKLFLQFSLLLPRFMFLISYFISQLGKNLYMIFNQDLNVNLLLLHRERCSDSLKKLWMLWRKSGFLHPKEGLSSCLRSIILSFFFLSFHFKYLVCYNLRPKANNKLYKFWRMYKEREKVLKIIIYNIFKVAI